MIKMYLSNQLSKVREKNFCDWGIWVLYFLCTFIPPTRVLVKECLEALKLKYNENKNWAANN